MTDFLRPAFARKYYRPYLAVPGADWVFALLLRLPAVSNLICGLLGKKQIERMFMKVSFDCGVRFFTARIREKILQIVFRCVLGADRGYALLP